MARLLRSHGLVFEGGVLAKAAGTSVVWNSNALFEVPDPAGFTVTLDVLQPFSAPVDPELVKYLVGIVPKDCKLSVRDIEHTKRVAFLDLHCNAVAAKGPGTLGRIVEGEWPVPAGYETSNGGLQQMRVEVTFMGTALYLAWEGQPRIKVIDEIPSGDYRPCISIANPGERLRVSIRRVATKRTSECHGSQAVKMAKRLWTNRVFTDATVVCGQKQIPVHRCVLAAASPFFEKAFQGEMCEAKEASIIISDVNDEVMEAFLQYLYTTTIPEAVEYSNLLQLAHRYECSELLDKCADDVLETLSEQNCYTYAKLMKPFEDDPRLGPYWTALAERIASDPALSKALLRQL